MKLLFRRRLLVCSKVGPSLLLLDDGLKVGCLRTYSSPMTFLFADEALARLFISLVSMRLSILVAAILLLAKKSLVLVLEAPSSVARFTHIGRESFEQRLEVPSTNRAIVGLKTFGLLVVAPQQCSKAEHFVSLRQRGPSRLGGRCCNAPSYTLDEECRVRACACLDAVHNVLHCGYSGRVRAVVQQNLLLAQCS